MSAQTKPGHLTPYQVLSGLIWGVASVGLLVLGLAAPPAVRAALPLAVGMALGCFLLIVVVHELGHVAGGLSQGFHFAFLTLGPLWFGRDERGRPSVRFDARLARVAGAATLVPLGSERLVRRMAIMIAAGPFANLALALLAGLGAKLTSGVPSICATLLAMLSFLVFVVNSVPFELGAGLVSDGARLRRLLGTGPLARREAAILALNAASASGTRPRDWPAETIRGSLEPADESAFHVVGLAYAALRLSDLGEHLAARPLALDAMRLATPLGPRVVHAIGADLAICLAQAGDEAQARACVALASGPAVEAHTRLQALAELALLEGRHAQARDLAKQGLEALSRPRYGTPSARERERLADLAGSLTAR